MGVMAKSLAILCLLLQAISASEHRRSIDLKMMMESSIALKKASLMWQYPPNAELYVYGDGRLISQAYPVVPDDSDNPFLEKNRSLVPTCATSIDVAEVRNVVRLMVEKHFFDLPEKNYMYQTAAYDKRKLELHTIAINNGQEIAERTFGIGRYGDKDEFIPPDFAVVEEALAKMRASAFSAPHKPCSVAAGIKF
jgi:hypothetical protein